MKHSIRSTAFAATFAACALISSLASAQLDRVYPTEGPVVSGTISNTNKNGVVITVGGAERSFTLDKIEKVVFNREPGPLTDGRGLVADEQYAAAVAQLAQIQLADIQRKEIKGDVEFFLAYCNGKLALAGQGNKGAAVTGLLDFLKSNSDSWHFFDAAKTLGDLALALGSYDNAAKYYGALAGSVNTDHKFESKYLVGWSKLQAGKLDEANQDFADVIGIDAGSPEQKRIQKLAMTGQATIAAKKGQPDQGLATVTKLIEESDPSDAELFGRLCNAHGALLATKSDPEGAVLAYLKTHLLFPSDPSSHVEALKELVELWPQIGHPERGNEARQILEKQYPGR